MAEGTPVVQVLRAELKTPSSTGDSTATYVDQGVSDVTNRNTVVRPHTAHYQHHQQQHQHYQHHHHHQQARPMMMEGNPNSGASSGMHYNSGYNNSNTYNQYNNNAYGNNNHNQYYNNQYNNSNSNYYGGGYNSYNRDYNNNGNSYNSFNKPPNSYNPPPEVTDGSVIDSALLAALRDQRERVALLRLEQVMIDFMNAPEGYLEVGGPYNSVVVSPNTSSKRFQNAASLGSDTGGRQTSFQRCLLHRLADRFGIVRETGTILEGSIRLIKQKDSKIPKVLLLDHIEESNKDSANKGGDTETLTAGMDNLQVSSQGGAAAPPTKEKKKSNKMKIMKRNSNTETNGQAKSTPRSRKNKNFSDKEKAYAEARARIFADEAASSNNADGSGQTQSAPASMAPSPAATPPPAPTSQNSTVSNNTGTSSVVPAQVHKSASTNNLNMPKRMSSGSLTMQDSGGNGDDLPPAASSGVSKATWRNRKEEENDPDFQRGAGLQTLVPVAAVPTYNVPIAGNAYYYQAAAPPYGQQQQAVAAYGYAGGEYNRGAPGRGRGGYPQQQYGYPQQQHYRSNNNHNNHHGDATNVNSMEEFPALR